MGFGAKPSPYSPELAVSEGLGAKLWCIRGIIIFSFLENYELKVKFNESRRLHLISFAKNSIINMYDYAKYMNGGNVYVY